MSLEYKQRAKTLAKERRELRVEKRTQVVLEDCREEDAIQEETQKEIAKTYDFFNTIDQESYDREHFREEFFECCRKGDYKSLFSIPLHPSITPSVLNAGYHICLRSIPMNTSHIVMASHILKLL